ncbi:glycosyltransferase family 1 protein [Parabacteroides timonensis]|uniref:glycosyltransferase family 4 protein n=1 Tax=Parabacteroides timonensis TaxID=1871013 RepID=UPI00094E1272|nr:glycosyltransferase family 1 protein [Parabacteroides timonensis]
MRILYDHQMFSFQKFGGVTRYFCDLMTNLPEGYEYELPILFSENQYLSNELFSGCKKIPCISSFRVKRRIYYFFNNSLSKRVIGSNTYDLFHPTYYDTYFLKKIKRPFVLTIHDMIHEKYPKYFKPYDNTSEQKFLLCKNAAHIISVSENTKKDLIDLFGIHPEKISVVYHGYSQSDSLEEPLFNNYILYVGERKGYKNFYGFIEAIIPLLLNEPDLKIVCTGQFFASKEIALFNKWKISNQLFHLSASEKQLASLYKYALFFVYPSLYEGFGIPILEAFKNGCPVCLSNSSCFPEIAGNAACYFDPLNSDSILDAVNKLLTNKEYVQQLRIQGKNRLDLFSLNKMVRGTCDVYERIR